MKPALCVDTEVSSSRGEGMGERDWPTTVGLLQVRLKNSEAVKSFPSVLAHLDEGKRNELVSLIHSYPALFSHTLSQTHLIEHDIDVGDAQPIKQRFYCVSPDQTSVMPFGLCKLQPLFNG